MKFTLRYRPEVVSDLDEASKWYDKRKVGLGAEFLHSAQSRTELALAGMNPRQSSQESERSLPRW
jgi:hypothetical protein